MESTNPRARIEPSWAPPPAIEAEPILGPSEEFSPDDAAAFDATLGSLVEQFASLPPASYGEPPAEMSEPRAAGASTRWGVPLAALGSMVLGGAITLAILIGPQQLWSRLTGNGAVEAAPAALAPSAPVDVQWTSPEPRTEPLKPKAATPPTTEVVAVVAAPIKPDAPQSTSLTRTPAKMTQAVKMAKAARTKKASQPKARKARKVVKTSGIRSKREKKAISKKSPKAVSAWKDPYE